MEDNQAGSDDLGVSQVAGLAPESVQSEQPPRIDKGLI